MKLHKNLLVLFLLFSVHLFSQENKSKGDFEVLFSYGSAKVEIGDLESIGYFTGSKFKKEFLLHKNYGVVTGVELNDFYLNASDFSIETKNIVLPVSFRYKTIYENSTLYAEFGANLNYQYKFEFKDNQNSLASFKEKNLGHSFGLFYKIGYKYNFNKNFKFNLAFVNSQDILANFKSDVPESKIKNQVGLEIGLAFNL